METSKWTMGAWVAAALTLGACGGGSYPVTVASKSSSAKHGSAAFDSARSETASEPPSVPGAAAEPMPSAAERPGLGTEWGETRYSHVHTTSFERMDPEHPQGVLSLYYNDREGARAMARYEDYREIGDAVVRAPSLGIAVSLSDDSGHPLPAFYAGGHTYAIGEAGQRYSIVVSSFGGIRVEAVASVDGLDVLDGAPADYAKRGYLVPARGSVEIDGFRQSDDHVAAFRFGSVRDSYAARTGSDRNVGVIGVALFAPRSSTSWPWTESEIQKRKSADPFPGKYASPPPPRW